ncbi:MAG: DUF2007 domain-containing protein [Bacteroidetes bacterium]|nr:DUF2007 domain-containing protein [Bacteroidota bacterium]
METKNKLVRVFAGSEITVNLLQYELEKEGIPTNIVNEYDQSSLRGYSPGTPYSVDLFVLDTDAEKAEPIVQDFMKNNKM